MDILSEIIQSSNWKADLLNRRSFPKNCGFIFPCDKSAGFHIVISGKLYLRYKSKIIELRKGDIVFLTKGLVHELVTSPNAKAINVFKFKEKFELTNNLKSGACTFISIRYIIPEHTLHPFFIELPQILLIRSEDLSLHHPLFATIQLISLELEKGLGSDILIQRFSDIILYYSLRYFLEEKKLNGTWFQAFSDKKLLLALEALHTKINYNWDLNSLSNQIGVSRVTLLNKFKSQLKVTPMDYLAFLRIEKGRQLLLEKSLTLEQVAKEVGYSTAFAYSKAYKRIKGVSPSFDV
jgi:AraC-like DNA-binding protein